MPSANAHAASLGVVNASDRSDRARLVGGMTLALFGGIGLVLSFPPVGLWPLVFVSFVPIAIAQHRVFSPRCAGLAPAVGVGTYVAYLSWGGLTAAQRWWLLLVVPLLLAAGWLDRRVQETTAARHLWWSSPALWTAALFTVGLTPLASWLDPAYALYRQPWLIQPVSVFSVSGLNLVILLTNYGFATAITTRRVRSRKVLALGVMAMLCGWIATSLILLAHDHGGRPIRVAAVQPGRPVQTESLSTSGTANAGMLAVLEADTMRAAAAGAQLIVWPEKALQYVDTTSATWRSVQQIVRASHAYVVVGYTEDPQRFNRAAVLDPSGAVLATYDKQHPVAFAGDHSVGGPVVVVHTPLAAIAPIICYDLDFQNTAREAARKGAQLLAVPSEDWSGIAELHYSHLVFRAVENRVAAIKADIAWDSAIIDPEGRIVAARVDSEAGHAVLIASVPVGSGRSPFATTGNWLGYACLALSLGWMVIAARALRRA